MSSLPPSETDRVWLVVSHVSGDSDTVPCAEIEVLP
jgi:hypothetical protein